MRSFAAFFLLLLVSAGPAVAQDRATVVVFDPGGEAGEAQARSAWLEQFGVDAAVRFVSVEAVLPADQSIVLLGDAVVEHCAAEPVSHEAFAAMNDSVADSLAMMEYAEAVGQLAHAEAALPCLSEAPPPMVLGRHHFLRGIAAHYADGHDAAVDRFEEGLLASPFLQWDESFPPPLKPAFEEAVTSALSASTAFLTVSGRLTAEGALWVDGLPVDPRTRTTTLIEGTHLLQWQPEGGALTSWTATVVGGSSMELVHREDGVADLLAGRAETWLTRYAWERVLAAVEREAGGRMLVAQPWEVVLFHEYDASSGRWWLADVDAIEDWRRSGRRMRGTGVGLVVGGLASMIVGSAVAVDGLVEADFWKEEIYGDDGVGTISDFNSFVGVHESARTRTGVGWGIAIAGTGVTIAGVLLIVTGHQRARATGIHKKKKKKAKQ